MLSWLSLKELFSQRSACRDGKQSTAPLPSWLQGPENCQEQSVSQPRGVKGRMLEGLAAHTYPLSLLAWPHPAEKPSALLLRIQGHQVILVMPAQEGAFYPNPMCVYSSLALGEYCKMVFFLPYSQHSVCREAIECLGRHPTELGHQNVNPLRCPWSRGIKPGPVSEVLG